MAHASRTVIATIQGREYTLACDAGQERHLQQLITEVDARAGRLSAQVGRLSESLLMLYVALMLADELAEARTGAEQSRAELQRALRHIEENADEARIAALEESMAETLHALAARIEGLAEKLNA